MDDWLVQLERHYSRIEIFIYSAYVFSDKWGYVKMGIARTIIIIMLLFLNFLGAIFLETKLKANFTLELVFIVIGLIFALGIILGLGLELKWGWPLATIAFSLYLANTLFLYMHVKAFLTFALMLFFNTMGLLISVVSIKEEDDFTEENYPVETYDFDEPHSVVYNVKPKSAKKTKKKKKK